MLKLHYKFDGNVFDSISSKNGIPNNISYDKGKIKQCVIFNSLDSYVKLPSNISIQKSFYDPISISCWIKIPSATNWVNGYKCNIIGNGVTDGSIGILKDIDGKIAIWLYGDNYYHTESLSLLTYDIWHNIVLVYSFGKLSLYIDGVINSTVIIDSVENTLISNEDWYIGSRSGFSSNNSYNLLMDDVKFFNHELSLFEVCELFDTKILQYKFENLIEPTVNISNPNNNFFQLNNFTGWELDNSNGSSAISVDHDFTSGRSVSIIPATNGNQYYQYSSINLGNIVGKAYTVSAKIKVSNLSNNSVLLYILWKDSNNNIITTNSQYIECADNSSNSRFEVTAEAPNGAYYVIALFKPKLLNGIGHFIFGDLQIEEKNHATSFTLNSRNSSKLIDSTSYGNTIQGFLNNFPKVIENSGKLYRNSLYFNKNILALPDDIGYRDEFSICLWFRYVGPAIHNHQIIIGGEGVELGFFNDSGHITAKIKTTSGYFSKESQSSIIIDGNWHFISIIVSNTEAKIFIDGILDSSVLIDGSIIYSFSDRIIGASNPQLASYYTNGILGSLEFYASAINNERIINKYKLLASIDSNGNFFIKNSIFESHYKIPLLNYYNWNVGNGNCPGFNSLGAISDNSRFIGNDPWGLDTIIWQANNSDSALDTDGGWDSTNIQIDSTKLYRISMFINRKTKGTAGYTYFIVYGYDSNNASANFTGLSTGASSTSFYFIAASDINYIPEDTWILLTVFIYPYSTPLNSTPHPDSGAYYLNKTKHISFFQSIKWSQFLTSIKIRSYLYATSDLTTKMQWVYPRIDLCDGSEPSISDLLSGYDSRIYEIGKKRNTNLGSSLELINNKTIIANINEAGITENLLGWFPLGNKNFDISGNNLLITTNTSIQELNSNLFSNHIINISIDNNLIKTISLWINIQSDLNITAFLIGNMSSTNSKFYLGIKDGLFKGGYGDKDWGITIPTNINIKTWYHVTMTYDGIICKLYLNGTLISTNTDGNWIESEQQLISVGSSNSAYFFKGRVRDIRLYNRILNNSEILINSSINGNIKTIKNTSNTLFLNKQILEI
jgi:hypothetical protein